MTTASIVIYNTPDEELLAVLESVEKSSIAEVYVIDHAATPHSEELCRRFPKVRYEAHPNGGYGTGHNHGLRKSLERNADYHVVINPDVFWHEDIIAKLERFMDEHPDCGLVMPRIIFPNGEEQYLCKLLPTPFDLIGRRFIPLKGYTERHNNFYELRWSGYDTVMEVPCLSGCFMFLRNDVIRKIGGFDERYFLYAEDMDLCRRIGEVSKTMFTPDAEITHTYKRESYKSFASLKLHMASVIKYFNKWGWFADKRRNEINRKCIEQLAAKGKYPDTKS